MRRARLWPTGGLLVIAILRLAGNAAAAPTFRPSTRVVLFTPALSDPLVARLEAELAAVGIAVRRVELPPDSQLDDVVTHELAAGASAAIRIIPRSRGTEVWTGDATARVSSRRAGKPDTSDRALSVIALRTVEFLRASLLDVKRRGLGNRGLESDAPIAKGGPEAQAQPQASTPPPTATLPSQPSAASNPNGVGERERKRPAPATAVPLPEARTEEPPPTVVSAPPAAPRHAPPTGVETETAAARPRVEETRRVAESYGRSGQRFEMAAGPAVLISPGGIAPIGAIAAIGHGRLVGRFGLELMAVLPVIPAHTNTVSGSVETSAALFGAAATVLLTAAPSLWLADVAAGAAATRLRSAGSGSFASAESTWKLTGHARMGAGIRLKPWLTCRADAFGGLVASRTSISRQMTGGGFEDYASWGPLFAGAMVSVQASWW